jgi:uncharacterized protein (DUF1330 family)
MEQGETMQTRYVIALATVVGFATGMATIEALRAQAKPPAYVIAEIDVTDPDGFAKEYAPTAGKVLTDAGGKFLVRGGKSVAIEGDPPKTRPVILMFDSLEKAQAAYASAAYKDGRKIGDKYAKWRIWAVEGVAQ